MKDRTPSSLLTNPKIRRTMNINIYIFEFNSRKEYYRFKGEQERSPSREKGVEVEATAAHERRDSMPTMNETSR